jgi:antitoxin (DNA-binding transcriptional repressor) of toxin-antitoxin stability system
MIYRIELKEAETRLPDLIRAAMRGDAVIITQDQRPLVQLVAVADEVMRPRFGSARGLVEMADDFDAPLEEFREYMP